MGRFVQITVSPASCSSHQIVPGAGLELPAQIIIFQIGYLSVLNHRHLSSIHKSINLDLKNHCWIDKPGLDHNHRRRTPDLGNQFSSIVTARGA